MESNVVEFTQLEEAELQDALNKYFIFAEEENNLDVQLFLDFLKIRNNFISNLFVLYIDINDVVKIFSGSELIAVLNNGAFSVNNYKEILTNYEFDKKTTRKIIQLMVLEDSKYNNIEKYIGRENIFKFLNQNEKQFKIKNDYEFLNSLLMLEVGVNIKENKHCLFSREIALNFLKYYGVGPSFLLGNLDYYFELNSKDISLTLSPNVFIQTHMFKDLILFNKIIFENKNYLKKYVDKIFYFFNDNVEYSLDCLKSYFNVFGKEFFEKPVRIVVNECNLKEDGTVEENILDLKYKNLFELLRNRASNILYKEKVFFKTELPYLNSKSFIISHEKNSNVSNRLPV